MTKPRININYKRMPQDFPVIAKGDKVMLHKTIFNDNFLPRSLQQCGNMCVTRNDSLAPSEQDFITTMS